MVKQQSADELALLVADVYELAGTLRRHGEEFAATVGQTQARWQLLSVLSVGTWTVPRVARRLGVSRQAVQRVADDLAAEDLVQYAANPEHQRSPLVQLTSQGHEALEAISAAARDWQIGVARHLDTSELASARAVLRGILDQIASADGAAGGAR